MMTTEKKLAIIKEYGKNEQDTGSPEVQVALLTARINELNEHFKNNAKWLQAYGRKYIKFGKVSIYNKDKYELKSLLTDIESSIIEEVEQEWPGELLNIQQKGSYNYHYNLYIDHINNDWVK